jgi:Polyketide cyclase / dehydrase and lipid transport
MKAVSVDRHVDAPPRIVVGRICDVARLPDWNRAITEVLQQPDRLVPGSQWKVRMRAVGQTWISRSTLSEIDEASGRFRYRSQSDDGNPSYADWDWCITEEGTGSHVVVTVTLNPLTFWRKYLLAHLRRPALHREMNESLVALSTSVQG